MAMSYTTIRLYTNELLIADCVTNVQIYIIRNTSVVDNTQQLFYKGLNLLFHYFVNI